MTLLTPYGAETIEEKRQLERASDYLKNNYSFDADNARRDEAHLLIRKDGEHYVLAPFTGRLVGLYKSPRTEESPNMMPEDLLGELPEDASRTIDDVITFTVQKKPFKK